MRTLHLLQAIGLFTLITFLSCDLTDDDSVINCDADFPALELSDGECEPTLLTFRQLDQPEYQSSPRLPLECEYGEGYVRKFQIPAAYGGNSNLALHLYNGTRVRASIQLFGRVNCSGQLETLTGCRDISAVVTEVEVENVDQYDYLYAAISYDGDADDDIQQADFFAVAAYYRLPEIDRVPYRGTNPENEYLARSCDGKSYNRLVVATCDPEADISSWQDELGLPESESYHSGGMRLVAYATPPRTHEQTNKSAAKRKRLTAYDDGTSVEVDLIIFQENLPAIIQYGTNEGNSAGQPDEALECRSFRSISSSTENRRKNVVIANIDSGVDIGGAWDDLWHNYSNKSVSGQLTQRNTLGFDFVDGDRTPNDHTGHGTATAGALIGNYRSERPATIVHYKVFGSGGESSYFGALVAINEATGIGANIINASWGIPQQNAPEALQCAINYATSRGALVFTAAGNDQRNINPSNRAGRTVPQWPASFSASNERVIAVTSYQFERGQSIESEPILEQQYANYGDDAVRLAAFMTVQTLRAGTDRMYYPFGTSISSPLAAARYATELAQGGTLPDFEATWRQSPPLINSVRAGQYLEVCDERPEDEPQ